jgi:hypothetical protein
MNRHSHICLQYDSNNGRWLVFGFLSFWSMLCCVSNSILSAQDVSPDKAKFFENEVRPLLARRCYECHSGDQANGDLQVDSLAALLQGGESGPALVRGKPDESALVDAINYKSMKMPPDEKLADAEIAILTRWVAMGAPWPDSEIKAPVRQRELFDEEDRKWWAIAPVVAAELPKLDATQAVWARNPIDHFIAERLASQGLEPAPEATKLALIRRLSLDVIGLPPTPEQVDAFVHDDSPEAYDKLVDRLLDSKGYGERAARQWLDLVRYADSDGYRADDFRPNAWRYRDYVIRSFNQNKPYDRFVQEQIAGDELFPEDTDAQIALGYLRHWVYEWNIRDARTQWKTILEDVTDTTADVFLGLGLQCAKCHNHKFDPLLQKDYLRLQAFLAPIMPRDTIIANAASVAEFQAKLAAWEEKTKSLRDQIVAIEQPYRDKYRDIAIDRFPGDLIAIARKSGDQRSPAEEQLAYLVQRQVESEHERLDQYLLAADKEKLVALRRELKEFDSLKPTSLPVAMAVSDVGPTAPSTVMPKRTSEIVEPGVPSILNLEPMDIVPATSGLTTGRRSALARWLTNPTNPLSTRVIVNRIWQSHFGRGLAENPSDFGRLGGPPSHPELLDWMTKKFIDDGWNLKSLHRLILLSATYRQSTDHTKFETFSQVDPANNFYWRRNTLRLSAEQIRDSLLLATGGLKDYAGDAVQLADSPYRTIYTRVMRNSPDQLLNSFDLPQFFSSNSTRNTTTTPVQSLLMFNSDLMLGFGRKLAAQLRTEASDLSLQVELAWRRVYGRKPTLTELKASLAFVERQRTEIEERDSAVWNGSVETAKLPYRDGQGVKFDMSPSSLRMAVPDEASLDCKEFTIECFFELRSIAKSGAVRTLVSKWNGSLQSVGWRFGVTGAGSRRKPQTLVMQMVGMKADGVLGEAAIFSDQHIQLNTPYYAAASYRLPRDGNAGTVTFHLKDLSNDDEQLLSVTVPHNIVEGLKNSLPLTFGGFTADDPQSFDGLIDDVRLTGSSLNADAILYAVENIHPASIGYWQFERVPGVMRNSVADRLHIHGRGMQVINLSPDEAALADFCHVLLNSNEFLYQN